MTRKILYRAACCAISLFGLPGIAAAADYAGDYDGAKITLLITPDGANYGGEIRMGDQKFPLTAHQDGDHLAGVFTAGNNPYNFTATQAGDELTLTTDGAVYQLHRHLINPLSAGAAPTSTPSAQSSGDALANYIVMNNNDVGRSLVREIPNAKSTSDALQTTFPDLAIYFGGRPKILGAYEDQKDHKSAFVSFTAQLNGQPVKGFVTTKMRDQGAVVFIVFGKASATQAEWATLTAKPAVADQSKAANGERDIKSEMAEVPLKPYAFPDGTGAVGLAEGWTTNAQTESNLLINGPADQKIRMAFGGTVYLPDNMMVRQGPQQNMVIAPYSADPATALANIIRANSALSQRRGGPTSVPEKLIKVVPVPAR
ncbi:MAG TPA: hypothetical protein VKK61_02060, partial [Tepidisphaeraceae bacterium]|nr:hypothetical protein [Tepidisphaeraceae bacterium]